MTWLAVRLSLILRICNFDFFRCCTFLILIFHSFGFHKDVIARMTAQIEVHHDDSLYPGSSSQVKGGGRVARLILSVFPHPPTLGGGIYMLTSKLVNDKYPC